MPKDSDVIFHGTGYIPEVKKPTLLPMATLFTVVIHCTKESATISGRVTFWQLILPSPMDPELEKLMPEPVSGGNVISSVTFSQEEK